MTGMIEADTHINIITYVFIRFAGMLMRVILFITMVASVYISIVTAITLSIAIAIAIAGAVANVKDNTTARAVAEKR